MQIDEKLLTKLEKLSTLKISNEKRSEVIAQLSEIVTFVEKLNELDLSQKEVVVSTIGGGTPFRKDEPKSSEVVDMVLKNAPRHDGHFFSVPKIIE
ncbi:MULTISPECIES: Asp-tRNA(Asn)/Glu-tRNA(Gln) amidotransferase subunit GatC [unclassified Campylobacter]|uniref:Asp-tRNA(Asn)/Glu-tRNA(Gln) amidotransferase subunit GatC n=1 Tax=unclassified Campylobacter TaxID=2593542 RepID=UPI001237CA0C|nr:MULTISPECIES: Asp-tRNA(Asn)/Glu-tRNA(Gln) amidotransferase subunit GatC [unclassified Campylobacter]KAA6226487.1 Asp-tRNA(Asn)/Glu-tRNA(Gln) amidotransferase subunit GatC [Campylobacter sp. LR185c]KAA6228622.1 Asp-tRNA(Asn)/Glu-tRNA(Gln) amidotransferase subunit GatC [Campylobacter sp. LR196d]KAA6229175.1 Asp-tRNA(Asn)/Glu-tRNA(Gln) amidotransferase subunit GatC [Campylobacter sp. LR286c]KAA6233966.1 Asp-tRNA(Asn)/Glu-tRNA(Gln) amidotransferase subunit GatC [Campylobacter sp. LR291e]KAA6234